MATQYVRRFTIINNQVVQYNLPLPDFMTTKDEYSGFMALIKLLEDLKVFNAYYILN